MNARQPIPRLWLMTDERQGDRLLHAVARLPRGAGVVFRHYGLERGARRRLFETVRKIARRRRIVLLLADDAATARSWRADGSHGLQGGKRSPGGLLRSASAHDPKELRAAERAGADFVFVSPVFPTRSHPGAGTLGPVRFGLLARHGRVPVIALGGMNARKMRRIAGMNVHGWAAIDAWSD